MLDAALDCVRSCPRLGDTLWYTVWEIGGYTVVDRLVDLMHDCGRLCGSLVIGLW